MFLSVLVGPNSSVRVAGIREGVFASHLFFVLKLCLLSRELVHISILVDIDVSGFSAPPFLWGFPSVCHFLQQYFVDVRAFRKRILMFLFSFIPAKLSAKEH